MTGVRLTKEGVKKRKPSRKNKLGELIREEVPDAIVPGLYLIIQPSGAKSWAVRYRWRGESKKLTLGKYPNLGLDDARTDARDALEAVEKGRVDPAIEKARYKEAPSDAVKDIVEDYIKRYVEIKTRPRSAEETKRALRKRVVPAWRGRSIADITRRDIIDLIEGIAEETPATAVRTRAAISGLFTWCLNRGILDTSPAIRLPAPTLPERDRVLSDQEIKTVWSAWDDLGEPFGPFMKLLLLTGQRRTEVATMRWEDVDLDKSLWTIPADRTKANRKHDVPLSPFAVEILSSLHKIGEFAFMTPHGSKKGKEGEKPYDVPISGFSKAKKRVDAATKNIKEPWRPHDLRRNCGTGMANLRVPRLVISLVLNHAEAGVTRIYDRHPYEDERRDALVGWGRYVRLIVDDELRAVEKFIAAARDKRKAEAKFREKIMASDREWQRYLDTVLEPQPDNVVELARQ